MSDEIPKCGNPIGDVYHERALRYGQLNDSWFAIRRKTREADEWRKYFEHIGWMPSLFKEMLKNDTRKFTVPAQWPTAFASEYKPVNLRSV